MNHSTPNLRGHTVAVPEMLSAGRLIASRLGHSPRAEEYKTQRVHLQREAADRGELVLLPSYASIHRAFPVWDGFLVAADLPPLGGRRTAGGHSGGRKQVCTAEVCMAAINAARRELRDPLTAVEYIEWRRRKITKQPTLIYTIPSIASIYRRFPNWRTAVIAAIETDRGAV